MLGPGRDRNRAAHEHEIIVSGTPVARHDELIMQTEEVEADTPVEAPRQHIAESHLPDQRIAALARDTGADALDRVEIPEVEHVGARLPIDPWHRGLDREPREGGAQALRLGIARRSRRDRAEREQYGRRSPPPDIRTAHA